MQEPRITTTEPVGADAWTGSADDLLPGDVLEYVRIDRLDIAGARLTDFEVSECVVGVLAADATDLRGLRIRDTIVESLDAPVFSAARTTWRSVRIAAGRIGSAELYDCTIDGVEFVGMKLGFVNLRGSRLTDVVFRDCVIDELDLGDATLTRVSFEGSSIREVTAHGARLTDVDLRRADLDRVERMDGLRGATIGVDQLYVLGPMLAQQAGYLLD